jgi:hypothetical protein
MQRKKPVKKPVDGGPLIAKPGDAAFDAVAKKYGIRVEMPRSEQGAKPKPEPKPAQKLGQEPMQKREPKTGERKTDLIAWIHGLLESNDYRQLVLAVEVIAKTLDRFTSIMQKRQLTEEESAQYEWYFRLMESTIPKFGKATLIKFIRGSNSLSFCMHLSNDPNLPPAVRAAAEKRLGEI